MKTLSIIKTGTTYPEIKAEHGDFEDWFIRQLGRPGLRLEVHDVASGAPLPEHSDGVLVTGSPAMVSERADWSERTAAWLARRIAGDLPVLGVCYGHQLLAHAMGGTADYHPDGREIGTLDITLNADGRTDWLLGALPDVFPAHLTHMQSAVRLPPNATLLASSNHEPHQAFRIGRRAWGVQFHPEFTAPIMSAYLNRLDTALRTEGLPVVDLRAGLRQTPEAQGLLRRFADLVERDLMP
ncbi:glutamine amidotransferase [Marinobacter nanhaiticus D15-8W]|uniref:Glutamine amidotransferase n=1 Tax=Marinobacter nanhaiticus D15-8W TaxID=626887 RepID=N6W9R3_9GAMM|nr:glutamine amidotransferase [Marinobacter nanhaiticus]ENO17014.1 glutamine amidotransferase [Marinobacter nanhaiticus D15-8W]BES71990.1 glutamine amidotransferase [Marinobacter nanhaiticus D15-8W]